MDLKRLERMEYGSNELKKWSNFAIIIHYLE